MKVIHASGKRKTSTARATLREGDGTIRINGRLLDVYEPVVHRLKLKEPVMLAGEIGTKVNISVAVSGGGMASQAEASRLAIARTLAEFDKKLERTFLDYDRHLMVADVRRKETHKPNRHGKARSKVQKSYR